jgi:hypothetical protein
VRFVDLEELRAQQGVVQLIEKAEEAARTVADELDPTRRAALIDQQRTRWNAFRGPLEHLIGSKCWYTESRNPGTDDDVDHFRPKSRVAEAPGHGGYWWLAFDWRNYRLSSHRANRARKNAEAEETHGKADHFPLLDETARWNSPLDACHEQPMLLDPTDPEDPPLLTYGMDGYAATAGPYADDPIANRRVASSAVYLHLNWPEFVEDRLAILRRVLDLVEEGESAAKRLGPDRRASDDLKRVARRLIGMASPKQPYSSAASAYIKTYRGKWWVEKLVIPHIW